MEEPQKETVIIVHGTWAAPDPAKRRWYEPVDYRRPGSDVFVDWLDAALQRRGSAARCWAHCTNDNSIFHWSGENSWIARTRAAVALVDYVAKLRKEGWRCHIVAHSHGGNVVVEALQQIAATDPNQPPDTIVTLGTPFMDTMSPILKRAETAGRVINMMGFISLLLLMMWPLMVVAMDSFSGGRLVRNSEDVGAIVFMCVVAITVALLGLWGVRKRLTRPGDLQIAAKCQPRLFAMGSPMDEPWQLLHHTRTMQNPLAVKSNLFSYLFVSLRSNISVVAQIVHIHGNKSYRDLDSIMAKTALAGAHGLAFLFILFVFVGILKLVGILQNVSVPLEHAAEICISFVCGPLPFEGLVRLDLNILFASNVFLVVLVLVSTAAYGESFFLAFIGPFRWCARQIRSLGSIFTDMATYVVRNRGWSVWQEIAMGLEGYRFPLPLIEQTPRNISQTFVKYENMPVGAEQRALERRSAWVARHLGDVSQTFSNLVLTSADISALLRTVEEDQTLVHAAYYTDEECIARIADWIAAGKSVGHSQ